MSCKTSIRFLLIGLLAFSGLAPSADSDDRVNVVAQLYRDFAWEVVITRPRHPGFADQPRVVLEKYLTPELAGLLIKERECVSRTKELCWLDAPPLWVGNDPGAIDLSVTAAQGTDVVARFAYPGSDQKLEVRFTMVLIGKQWRVSDIRKGQWSMKKTLETPL
jgi:hypothetical protein